MCYVTFEKLQLCTLGNLFATGAKDGSLILWSANFLNAIKKFECSNEHLTDVNETVESDTDGPMAINYIMVLCEVMYSSITILCNLLSFKKTYCGCKKYSFYYATCTCIKS